MEACPLLLALTSLLSICAKHNLYEFINVSECAHNLLVTAKHCGDAIQGSFVLKKGEEGITLLTQRETETKKKTNDEVKQDLGATVTNEL